MAANAILGGFWSVDYSRRLLPALGCAPILRYFGFPMPDAAARFWQSSIWWAALASYEFSDSFYTTARFGAGNLLQVLCYSFRRELTATDSRLWSPLGSSLPQRASAQCS